MSTLEMVDGTSRTSLDSKDSGLPEPQTNGNSSFLDFTAFDRIRDRLGSIVKTSVPQEPSSNVLSSAGLLITSGEGTTTNTKPENPLETSPFNKQPSPRDLSPRMLARSDSFAGDSKFIDKLQKQYDSKLKCQKSLKFNEIDEELNGDGQITASPTK